MSCSINGKPDSKAVLEMSGCLAVLVTVGKTGALGQFFRLFQEQLAFAPVWFSLHHELLSQMIHICY